MGYLRRDHPDPDTSSLISAEDDERSICTTATTASLASRIQSLAVDFGPKHHEKVFDGRPFVEDDEDEVVSMTEEDLLKELERQEPAIQVCLRLFKDFNSSNLNLKRLSVDHAETFKQRGFVVVDNFIASEYAGSLRAEGVALNQEGLLQEAASLNRDRPTDETARGDSIFWLHQDSAPPAFSGLMTAFMEMQEDLSQIMQLRMQSTEFQLGYYPPNGAQYVRHRDGFPDDGSESDQRRVTAILYLNPSWKREDGGKLRLWLPQTESVIDHAPLSSQSSHTAPYRTTALSPAAANHVRFQENGHHHASENGFTAPDMHRDSARNSGNHSEHNGMLPDGHAADRAVSLSDGDDPLVQSQAEHAPLSPTTSLPETQHSEGGNASAGAREGHGQLSFEAGQNMRLQSGGSINGSLIVEATEDSSNPDAASLDGGSSVRSLARQKAAEGTEVGTAAAIDIAPTAGRLVLFLSGAVEHAVLPNFSDRLAVTCWCQ